MTGYNDVREIYAHAAPSLRAKWDTIDLKDWLKPVAPYLTGRTVLDVGAGTGRLSAHLASTANVTAVEPVKELWDAPRVRRIDDKLPRLESIRGRFDLVLCLGVLHHLTPFEQMLSMRRLAALTKTGGKIIVAARHGPRQKFVWPIRAAELSARELSRSRLSRRAAIQQGNRAKGVHFTWLVFTKTHVPGGSRR